MPGRCVRIRNAPFDLETNFLGATFSMIGSVMTIVTSHTSTGFTRNMTVGTVFALVAPNDPEPMTHDSLFLLLLLLSLLLLFSVCDMISRERAMTNVRKETVWSQQEKSVLVERVDLCVEGEMRRPFSRKRRNMSMRFRTSVDRDYYWTSNKQKSCYEVHSTQYSIMYFITFHS